MVLTGITREEEKRMKKNEKQIIISLGVVIAVVAIALIAMMITSGNSDNGQSSSLKMPYNKNQTVMEVMMSVNLMRVNLYLKKMQGNQETI